MTSDQTRKRPSLAGQITMAAMVAALYAVLSYFGNIFGLTYGPIQCRFSEALCVLPFLFPATVPGLFVGCLITNLMSTVGPLDIVLGSLATLLAAFLTSRMPNRWLAPLPPVICNGVIIGAMIAWYEVGFGPRFWGLFAFNGITVALGELLACYVLGEILLTVLPRVKYFRGLMSAARLDLGR
ncbi:QueT transporter family protein [Pseudoflavonifractor sp. MSJ-37]|uniref:QueT transporter family protein n=1 Tax=Pseudoflavonifractor sp. MSJ-37 TaxID=2841531 RepID=UPI001C1090B3|nr:QueT transporter family protein [Pseudoflavonifractor sp. MSJ-37]MBU5435795.1 QueT transporter family protein [Pseudoflavonifractor sp. MSJ-37]